MHSCPEAHRWGMVGSQIMVTIMGNNLLVEPEEVCYNGGSWKREITFASATNMNKLWTCQKSPSKKSFSEYSGKYLQKRVRKAFIYAGSQRQVWKWRSPLSGHWHSPLSSAAFTISQSGNEGHPFQGIDTLFVSDKVNVFHQWKWRSPLSGHWHSLNSFFCCCLFLCGNEGRPFQGIDTVNYMQPLLMNIMM